MDDLSDIRDILGRSASVTLRITDHIAFVTCAEDADTQVMVTDPVSVGLLASYGLLILNLATATGKVLPR